jgi:tetratricopeptide (TPR) repeat protein
VLLQYLPKRSAPMETLKLIDSSIEKFRQALAIDNKNADAMFNLGQALNTRAETVQDVDEIEDGYSQAALAVQEAISILDEAYALQEQALMPQLENMTIDEPTNAGEDEEEHSHDHHSHEEPGTETLTTVTEVIPTTAYTLIDTLVASANALSTMASMLANFEKALSLFDSAQDKLKQAEKWLGQASRENEKDYQQAVIQITLQHAQTLALLADRSMTATGQVDDKTYTLALEKLDFITSKVDSRHCEAMCDRGDLLSQYAQAKQQSFIRSGRKLDADPSGKEVWQLYSQASKSFQEALQIESKNNNILRKLGDISLIRAQLPMGVADRNKLQLLKNAEFYYKQVLESDKEDLYGAWLGWAVSSWAQGEWCQTAGKHMEAEKIIKMWIKRGGNDEIIQDAYEESDFYPKAFIDWVMTEFFADETDSE